jgi:hypothetical protein
MTSVMSISDCNDALLLYSVIEAIFLLSISVSAGQTYHASKFVY